METNTCELGIDLNDSYAMVSFFQANMKEPETVSTIAGSENYRIPTLLARRKNVGMWYYGEEAQKMAKTSEVICVDDLLRRAAAAEVITIARESYAAVELLALFIRKVIDLPQKLGNTAKVAHVVITVERLTRESILVFRKVAKLLELTNEQFLVADHKECFYAYALHQEKSLWSHDVCLFSCQEQEIRSLALKRDVHTHPQLVTIESFGPTELDAEKDVSFVRLLEQMFAHRQVSSVYLVGDGFEGEWMKQSLTVLCHGRRAFLGQNLFSKGACYVALIHDPKTAWPYVYMGENEMKFNLSLAVLDRGKNTMLNLVSAGKNWFELHNVCEVILSGEPQISFYKQLPSSREPEVQNIDLHGLPIRPDRATRLRITVDPVSDDKIEVEIRDLGFGEIFPASEQVWNGTIKM